MLLVSLVLIPTPFCALTKNVLDCRDANEEKLLFHTNVLSCNADAYCPAAKEFHQLTTLFLPHGIVLSVQLITLNPHPPMVLLLPYSIVLNCPPPIKFLLPAQVIVLLVPPAIVLPSPSAVIELLFHQPMVNNVPSTVLLYPHAIVLIIQNALLLLPHPMVFG